MIKITNKDLFWSYLGFSLNISYGLILLPFLLHYLSAKEIGLWYTFMSISSFVALLDFGFSPTLTRNVSYVWGGVKKLNKVGIGDEEIKMKKPNYKLFFEVFLVTKKIYFFISLFSLLLLLSIGSIYILNVTNDFVGNDHIIAWVIFCFGVFLNMFFSYWTPLLRGIGAIKQGQIANIISRVVQIVITLIGLVLSFNLIGISIAYFVSGFCLRFISKYYFLCCIDKKSFFKESVEMINKNTRLKELFDIMWFNSWKLGLVALGAFLITQSNILICSIYFGLDVTASYGITLQLFSILTVLSSILYNVYLPELNIAILYKNSYRVKKILISSILVNWVVFIIGSIFLVIFADLFLNFIQSSINLLPLNLLIFMAIFLFLENNHSMFSTFITSENRIPFVNSSIISGISVFLLSIISVYYTHLGLFGLLFSQAIVQLAYNNWKWPLEVIKKYNFKFNELSGYVFNR
jgi:O-antigen/teichoic acid export membrane protein